MKERVSAVLRISVLAVAAVALVTGVAQARTAAARDDCFYSPPYYVGACVDDPSCKLLCEPYWPGQGVGGCTTGPFCCICE